MNNVEWIQMQNARADKRLSILDEIDDLLYGVFAGIGMQPATSASKIDHECGVYTMPIEPLAPTEPKVPAKTELQKQFEGECADAFPDHFDFLQFPDGTYAREQTRYTFAGYELAHKNLAKGPVPEDERVDDGSGNLVLIFEEVRIYNQGTEYYREETNEYQVSTRKLAAFKEDSCGYDYVEHIVEAALAGKHIQASRKYSFGDTPDWWEALKPDANCKDPIKRFEYEIYC